MTSFSQCLAPKTPISLKYLAQKSLQDLYDSGANPPFQPSHQPKMPDIGITAEGIDKLLVGLNQHKAAGLDKFKPIVLQPLLNVINECNKELALPVAYFPKILRYRKTTGKRQSFPNPT